MLNLLLDPTDNSLKGGDLLNAHLADVRNAFSLCSDVRLQLSNGRSSYLLRQILVCSEVEGIFVGRIDFELQDSFGLWFKLPPPVSGRSPSNGVGPKDELPATEVSHSFTL